MRVRISGRPIRNEEGGVIQFEGIVGQHVRCASGNLYLAVYQNGVWRKDLESFYRNYPAAEPLMRARLAEALGVELERVNVKATRGEGMGFIGRQEGAAACSVATIALLRSKERTDPGT